MWSYYKYTTYLNFSLQSKKFLRNATMFSQKLYRHVHALRATCLCTGLYLSNKENFSHVQCDPGLGPNFIADAVEKAAPAVVNIKVAMNSYSQGAGSGFFISPDGFIVTNAHVVGSIRNAKYTVTLADGRTYPGVVHSMDRVSDIALVKITTSQPLPILKFGASETIRAGEWVVALGSPLSLQNSVSAGIISATARCRGELGISSGANEFIQTDAAINVGNSGGPLVNLQGQVVGVNVMKAAGYNGISFAIPSDTVSSIVEQLMKHKSVHRPYIGINLVQFDKRRNALDAISKMYPDVESGVVILNVQSNSPGRIAGLQRGDLIVEFDGQPVHHSKDIINRIGHESNRQFIFKVRRQGQSTPLTIPLTTA